MHLEDTRIRLRRTIYRMGARSSALPIFHQRARPSWAVLLEESAGYTPLISFASNFATVIVGPDTTA